MDRISRRSGSVARELKSYRSLDSSSVTRRTTSAGRPPVCACALALFLLAPGGVLAAHPLVTDDTGTQGRSKLQMELVSEVGSHSQWQSGAELKESAGEVAAVLSLGLLESVDLVLGAPFAWSRASQGGAVVSDEKGFGEATVELKWRFFEHEGFSLALKPGLTFGGDDTAFGAAFIATQVVGPFSFHANGAYTRNEFKLQADREANRSDIWHGSIAVAAEVLKGLQAVANVGAETNGDRGSGTWPAFALGGVVYALTEKLDVDLGVKAGLNSAEPELTAMAGMAWRF
jgi:hypothetical protein